MKNLSSLFQTLREGAQDRRWWYSTVHLVTIIIGAGVLGIPSAMVYLGWWGGMSLLLISYIITLCTLWQMVHLHHLGDERIDRLPDLGRKAFGDRGFYFMFALQIILQSAVNVTYLITGGYSISLVFSGLNDYKAILVFTAAQYLVCVMSDFASSTWLSAVSMLMSIGYTTIIWGSALHLHLHSHLSQSYDFPNERRLSKTFNALGQIVFLFGGQNVVLDIQSLIRSPSTKPMWHGVLVSYLIIACCYFPVAAAGYWAYGNLDCYGNVLAVMKSPDLPKWIFNTANVMLVLHLTGAYQVYSLPVYEILQKCTNNNRLSSWIFSRYLYITCTCLVALLIPFYKNVVSLIGGLVIGPTSYFLPCILWLRIKKPERFSLTWIGNMACILFGATVTILASIGSLWEIIHGVQKRTHTPFHFLQGNCSLQYKN